jgi:hypothetical protein
VALLLEVGLSVVITAYHWLWSGNRDNFTDTSPYFGESPYWNEQKDRRLRYGRYYPYDFED